MLPTSTVVPAAGSCRATRFGLGHCGRPRAAGLPGSVDEPASLQWPWRRRTRGSGRDVGTVTVLGAGDTTTWTSVSCATSSPAGGSWLMIVPTGTVSLISCVGTEDEVGRARQVWAASRVRPVEVGTVDRGGLHRDEDRDACVRRSCVPVTGFWSTTVPGSASAVGLADPRPRGCSAVLESASRAAPGSWPITLGTETGAVPSLSSVSAPGPTGSRLRPARPRRGCRSGRPARPCGRCRGLVPGAGARPSACGRLITWVASPPRAGHQRRRLHVLAGRARSRSAGNSSAVW